MVVYKRGFNGSIIRNQVIFYHFSIVLAALNGFVQWFAAKGVFRERVQGSMLSE